MKKFILLNFIHLLFFLQTSAQQNVGGQSFGQNGIQKATQTFFDYIGNRYQVIVFTNSVSVDSVGYPLSIQNIIGQPTTAILKYDSNGQYQYCIRLNPITSNPIDIKFDHSNNLYLHCQFVQTDSLLLYHANGQFYKNIKPIYRKRSSDSRFFSASVIAKLSPNGLFLWSNTVYRESIPSSNFSSRNAISLNIINGIEFLKLLFVNTRLNTGISDTVSYLDINDIKGSILLNTQHLLLTYTTNGDLISSSEPFKNRLKNDQKDSIFNFYKYLREVRMIAEGKNNYAYINLYLNQKDTFNSIPQVPIVNGNVYFLIKFNENDSIIWIKPLYVGKDNLGYASNMICDIDIDNNHDQIYFTLNFSSNSYQSLFKPSLNSFSLIGSFIFKFNFDGQINGQDSFAAGTNFFINSYDYITGNKISVGQINSSDPRIMGFVPGNLTNKIFLGLISINDSGKIMNPVIPLISNSNRLSNTVYLNNNDDYGNIIDSRGKIYVSGYFKDSIQLPCNNLYSTPLDTDQLGNYQVDGFVLFFEPIKKFKINSCGLYVSPSLKYVWDSSGVYSDTLASIFGCDSIIQIEVNIMRSRSVIDSTVCNRIVSFSSKYWWDTSGVYLDTIPNKMGCDSIIILNLIVKNSFWEIDTSVKYSFISPSRKQLWNLSGIYFDTLVNNWGCDSIIKINLKVLSTKNIIDTMNCNSIKFFSTNDWMTKTGTYYDTIPNSVNADSILTINFILGSTGSNLDTTYCNQILSPSGRYIYNQSGIYTDTLKNALLCDSIITIRFTMSENQSILYINSCDSIQLPGSKLYVNNTGLYFDTIQTIMGCDSVLKINFTNLTTKSELSISVCDSLLSPSGKIYFHESGNYFDTITNQFGCDSIIHIILYKPDHHLEISKINDINCKLRFSQLSINDNLWTSIKWSPKDGLNDINSPSPIASPIFSTTYSVKVKDSVGCYYFDSVFVKVSLVDSLGFFPNIFTPNDDGINDCIPLNSLTEFREFKFFVYNRWGNLVFETDDDKLCWQGYSKNNIQLIEGVYYYVISGKSVCDNEIVSHGTITIIY